MIVDTAKLRHNVREYFEASADRAHAKGNEVIRARRMLEVDVSRWDVNRTIEDIEALAKEFHATVTQTQPGGASCTASQS